MSLRDRFFEWLEVVDVRELFVERLPCREQLKERLSGHWLDDQRRFSLHDLRIPT